MLDSRYLYLHQALELGPMWLSNRARVVAAEPSLAIASSKSAVVANNPAAKVTASAINSHSVVLSIVTEPSMSAVKTITMADPSAVTAAIVPAPITEFDLAQLPQLLYQCQRCDLHQERTKPLIGHGSEQPRLMVISMNPAPEDDSNQQLFSGQSSLLLQHMLAAIEVEPSEVFYTTQVKCAPNLSLHIQEQQIQACLPYLTAQIKKMRPQAILLLGQCFDNMDQSQLAEVLCHCPYVITVHPARLLRQSQLKAQAWQVLQNLRRLLI